MAPQSVRKPLRMGQRRRGEPLPLLGDLRKGSPKGTPLRELSDFRICNFNESDQDVMAFLESHGQRVEPVNQAGEPLPAYYLANHLKFVFHDKTIDDNLMVTNECYRGKTMIHQCEPVEGGYIMRALDPVTFRKIIVDGYHVETGERVRCDGKPIYSFTNGKGEEVSVGCSTVVRMRVMLRGQGCVAVWNVLSSSAEDGEHLTHQLETFYDAFASSPIPALRDNGLRGIPFILHRTPPIERPYYDASGARKVSKHSFIEIELDRSFGALYMESAVMGAIGAVSAPMQITGPATADDDEDILDDAVGGISAEEEQVVIKGPKPAAPVVINQAAKPAAPVTAPAVSGELVTLWNGNVVPASKKVGQAEVQWFIATYIGDKKVWPHQAALYGNPAAKPKPTIGSIEKHLGNGVKTWAHMNMDQFNAFVRYTQYKEGGESDVSLLDPRWFSDKIAEFNAKHQTVGQSADPDPILAAAQQLGAVITPVSDLAAKIIAMVKNLNVTGLDRVVSEYYTVEGSLGKTVEEFIPNLSPRILGEIESLLLTVENGLVDPNAESMLDTLRLGE